MPFPKGKKQSKEHTEKIKDALLGIKRSEEFKQKLKIRNLGKVLTEDTKKKISLNRKGKGIGNKNGLGKNLGNKYAFGKVLGEKNGNWKGGLLKQESYAKNWYRSKNEKRAGRIKPENCEVCGLKQSRICFDHNHKTGEFRGWLCSNCNTALGLVKDNPVTLKLLSDYLLYGVQKYQCDKKDIQPK